jgi:cephalosporin hydroxylase
VPPAFDQERRSVIDEFHRILYDSIDQSLRRSYCISWLGYEMLKWPTDLWVYHDIVVSMRPDVIVETGTHRGGSALFLATLCDLLQQGQVITIDIDETHKAFRPLHPRIAYLTGSSTDPAIVDQVRSMIAGRRNVIVILDADHNRDHVLAELRIYSELVPPNGYLIAEDTNINGHPAYPDFGPGPWEAVEQFLSENPDFVRDHSCERFLVSMNPSGFLRRKANTE